MTAERYQEDASQAALRGRRVDELLELDSGLDRGRLQEHLKRLSAAYTASTTADEALRHWQACEELDAAQRQVVVLFSRPSDLEPDEVDVTVVAYDHRGELSVLTGILAACGVSIQSGELYTSSRPAPAPWRRRAKRRPRTAAKRQQRKIIDRFRGRIRFDMAPEVCERLIRQRIEQVFPLLEQRTPRAASEVRHRVNLWVSRALDSWGFDPEPFLLPVQVDFEPLDDGLTRMRVVAQDTPLFLYSLSVALDLQNLVVERVDIRTVGGQIEDTIDLTDAAGRGIDQRRLHQIQLSVLVTKQFTQVLDRAPDPYRALTRFQRLLEDAMSEPREDLLDLLAERGTMSDLARVLGASDFLWEDFIRRQYETLLPLLPRLSGERAVSFDPAGFRQQLRQALDAAPDAEAAKQVLNQLKDQAILELDLQHILNPTVGFRELAQGLTVLAEAVVSEATRLVYGELTSRFGEPLTAGDLPVRFAVLGLGKLGGAALGYASDIELLFVYSDQGKTRGGPDGEQLQNHEFFERLVRDMARTIEARREGIFEVDLRLRPHGKGGPLACSLDAFCQYYGPGGQAHSYERLALVRMRSIGGDADLGARLERLRDEYLYEARNIDISELRDLREKQYRSKSEPGRINAKFSPGGLVDVEYSVQILQVLNGGRLETLRTPRVHDALEAMARARLLESVEAERIAQAYDFFRRLINALRMLRGSAKDLFLPERGSLELEHLARRMGYAGRHLQHPSEELHLDYEANSATVRTFVEKHLGRDSIPGGGPGNVADVLLSRDLDTAARLRILESAGFSDPARGLTNLQLLGDAAGSPRELARTAILAVDLLRSEPDADMALNNWQRFVDRLGPDDRRRHFEAIATQPRRLEILLGVCSRSQHLANLLIRHPEAFEWVTDATFLHNAKSRELLRRELDEQLSHATSPVDVRESAPASRLAAWQSRELLRIATRDMCLGAPLAEVTAEISDLADCAIGEALDQVLAERRDSGSDGPPGFAIFALGKLGGSELNYSSDIDLLACYDGEACDPRQAARTLSRLCRILQTYSGGSPMYRTDLRLRPYGNSGELAVSAHRMGVYYAEEAALWELQAMLKLRPVTGDPALIRRVLDDIFRALSAPHDAADIRASVSRMRAAAIERGFASPLGGIDVKNAAGGLRDIEFMVQALQLTDLARNAKLWEGNTLRALELLRDADLLGAQRAEELRRDYVFLRRVEHFLQILQGTQTHALPEDPARLASLARRMMGPGATTRSFLEDLERRRSRVRRAYLEVIEPAA